MLCCCEDFATNHSLRFNPSKTQLIRFFRSPSSSCSAHIYFCGQVLPFLDTISLLSHLLHYDDTEDVNSKLCDMVRKALAYLHLLFLKHIYISILRVCNQDAPYILALLWSMNYFIEKRKKKEGQLLTCYLPEGWSLYPHPLFSILLFVSLWLWPLDTFMPSAPQNIE